MLSSIVNWDDETREFISGIVTRVTKILEYSRIKIPPAIPLEISHHYGMNQFFKFGCVMISVINRSYCKKIIILFPGQTNPTHMHRVKEETFQILDGNLILTIDGSSHTLTEGELFTVEPGMLHSFYSEKGCIFEEISTSHNLRDSYYKDYEIAKLQPMERKTIVSDWQ